MTVAAVWKCGTEQSGDDATSRERGEPTTCAIATETRNLHRRGVDGGEKTHPPFIDPSLPTTPHPTPWDACSQTIDARALYALWYLKGGRAGGRLVGLSLFFFFLSFFLYRTTHTPTRPSSVLWPLTHSPVILLWISRWIHPSPIHPLPPLMLPPRAAAA